ncbi:transposase [Streptomyces sp. NPDC049687]|uniref:transposase n=1 Tax=Streptomyces sp. NPDC049687 TaxID=3365596 RepID=UPI003788A1C2
MSLSAPGPASEALDVLSRLRAEFYECLYARADALFELTDAVLCADGPVKTLVELSLAVEHRRGHGALYAALDRGWLEPTRLRRALAGLPLPKAADGRMVLAVVVSHWLRRDAPTSGDRLFCHVYGRGDRSSDELVPPAGPTLRRGLGNRPHLLDALRLGRADDATTVTADQLRDGVGRLTSAGQGIPGDPDILIVRDSGYDIAYLPHALAGLPVVLAGRLRPDRVMPATPAPPGRVPGAGAPAGMAASSRSRSPTAGTRPTSRPPRTPPATARPPRRPGTGCTPGELLAKDRAGRE